PFVEVAVTGRGDFPHFAPPACIRPENELVVDVVMSRLPVPAQTVRSHVLLPPVDVVLGACSSCERQRQQHDPCRHGRPPSLESQPHLHRPCRGFQARASIRRAERYVNSLFWTVSPAATA